MATLIPLASGKGGVGKTVTAVNLAMLLASRGKTTILADLDWGGSNAHTVLGVKNTRYSLGAWIQEGGMDVQDLVIPLEQPHLFFIPGDGLIPGTANLPYFKKRKLIKELNALTADYVILDLGAGTAFNTVDLFLSCGTGYVVSTPEPTAILNAYSFIKTCLYRLISQTVTVKSGIRGPITDFFCSGLEFSDALYPKLDPELCLTRLASASDEQRDHLKEVWKSFVPGIIINMGQELDELRLGARLRQICRKHLGTEIEYLGFLPWDTEVRESVIKRVPLAISSPEGNFIKALTKVSNHLIDGKAMRAPLDLTDQSDLEQLGSDYLELAGIK